ncbi:MAG: AAA family ATPase [Planctomycetaceae bacterium]
MRRKCAVGGRAGLGKTELVKALSQVLKLEFRRIQFTPDLMPADVIGTNIMTTDDAGNTASNSARSDFHAVAAGRRNQPRDAEDTIGAP